MGEQQAAGDTALQAIRDDLVRSNCPPHYIEIACNAASRALENENRAAAAHERERVVLWLKAVSETFARRARGSDSAYWTEQLHAYAHAADSIARERHTRPH